MRPRPTFRGVTDSFAVACPHCGETFNLPLDPSEGAAVFTYDCEVCCRPMTVRVQFDGHGNAAVDVEPE